MVAKRLVLPRFLAYVRVALAISRARLANVAGMMGPMLQAAQNQQVLMTSVLQTMHERGVGEGYGARLREGLQWRS